MPQPQPANGHFFSIQLFQHLRDLAWGLLQLRFLRLQSFSPSECQDENPADQGVVVQKRARQCYLWCEANDHVGMTVLFQTWPNLDRNCPWLLGSLATPTVEVQPSWSGVCLLLSFWLTPASTRRYNHSTCQHSSIPGALVTKQVGQISFGSTTILSSDGTWPPRRLLAFWSYPSSKWSCLKSVVRILHRSTSTTLTLSRNSSTVRRSSTCR